MSIEISQLKFQRGHFIKGPINFTCESQGLYVIKGSNGSGKTSLLKVLANRIPLAEGSIIMNGDVAGFGFEKFIFEDWSVNQMWKWTSHFVDPWPTLPTSLSTFENHKIRNLSSGWRNRLELEMVFELNRKILLLDEPFNALDSENKSWLVSKISAAQESKLIILTSHLDLDSSLQPKGVLQL